MSLAISAVFIFDIEQVLYKQWKFTLQIISFFFEWVTVTTR